jgi:hypothetical protein
MANNAASALKVKQRWMMSGSAAAPTAAAVEAPPPHLGTENSTVVQLIGAPCSANIAVQKRNPELFNQREPGAVTTSSRKKPAAHI